MSHYLSFQQCDNIHENFYEQHSTEHKAKFVISILYDR